MEKAVKKRGSVILIAALLAVFATVLTGISVSFAEEPASATTERTITIAHISDLHYFAYDQCYLGGLSEEEYKKTDYYKEISGDTKLMAQGGTILNATILGLIEAKPDVLLVSGDLTSDSEIRANYDVANALRYLQNKLRENGKPDFQVLVTVGNHDLYNSDAAVFDSATGVKTNGDDLITSADAIPYIYNGLGYPALTESELTASPIGSAMLEYYRTNGTSDYAYTTDYIYSPLSAAVTDAYYYSEVSGFPTTDNKAQSCLSYIINLNSGYTFAVFDSLEREKRDIIGENSTNGTQIAWEHKTGGRLSDAVLAWAKDKLSAADGNTVISMMHHNVLPHYTMEEQYTKDFTLYNWEETAEYLADELGVRYNFSGHMHANDLASRITKKGNVIYDMETGSLVSLYSPTRYTTITTTSDSLGKIIEETADTVTTKVTDISQIKSVHIDNPESDKSVALFGTYTDLEYEIGNEIYDKLVERLLDSFVNEDLIGLVTGLVQNADFSSIPVMGATLQMYQPILTDLVALVLNDAYYEFDYDIAGIQGENLGDYIHKLIKKALGTVYTEDGVSVTTEQVLVWAYKQHLMGGERPELDDSTLMGRAAKAAEEKMRDGSLIENLFNDLLTPLLYEENSILKQLFYYEFDLTQLIEKHGYPEDPMFDNVKNFLDMFFGSYDETRHPYFTKKLTVDALITAVSENSIIMGVLSALGGSVIETVNEAINTGVIDWAEDFLDKYLTDSFYTAIGGILADSMLSFTTDSVYDGITQPMGQGIPAADKRVTLIPYKGAVASYSGTVTVADNPPTAEDGRLPSLLTSVFGDNPDTGRNISWYTGYDVGGKLLYREKGASEWNIAAVNTQTVIVSEPLIDLGIFATMTETEFEENGEDVKFTADNVEAKRELVFGSVKRRARHTVTLSGLKAGTEYEYLVYGTFDFNGNGVIDDSLDEQYCLQNYLPDWQSGAPFAFTTAPSTGSTGSFTILAYSDLQGTIADSYYQAYDALKAAQAELGGYDLMINSGDVVDNGKNIKQWGYALNILTTVFGNTSPLIAAGNHEDGENSYNNYFNFGGAPDSQSTETGLYYSLNYGSTHIVVLNTNDVGKSGLNQAQLDWLTSDLETAKNSPNIKWTIVVMHKGLYSVGSHVEDTDVKLLRAQLTPVFYNGGVDLVLQGHDHVYNTTKLLGADGEVIADAVQEDGKLKITRETDGVLYVTVGTIADKYYEYRNNPALDGKLTENQTIYTQLTCPTFAGITVTADEIQISSYAYADLDDGKGTRVMPLSEYKAYIEAKPQAPEGSNLWWLWTLIAVVAAAGIGAAVYFFVIKKKKAA